MAFAVSGSRAGEVHPAHISQDASWFAHFDFEAGADSEIFKKLTKEQDPGTPSRLGEWLASRYGIDLEKLDGLTMYSQGSDQASTVSLLYGDIYEQKLLNTIKQHTDVNSREVGNVTYHSWKVDHEQKSDRPGSQGETVVTAAFLDDVAVFANDMNQAEQAVTAIQNKRGLDAQQDQRLQQKVEGTVLVQAVVLDVGKTQAKPSQNGRKSQTSQSQADAVAKQSWALLGDVDTISVAIGEMNNSDKAFVAVQAKAKSEQSARRVGDVLDGLQALAALSKSENDFDLGSVRPDVEQEGPFLRIGWTLDIEQVANIIDRKLDDTTLTAEKSDENNAVSR